MLEIKSIEIDSHGFLGMGTSYNKPRAFSGSNFTF